MRHPRACLTCGADRPSKLGVPSAWRMEGFEFWSALCVTALDVFPSISVIPSNTDFISLTTFKNAADFKSSLETGSEGTRSKGWPTR